MSSDLTQIKELEQPEEHSKQIMGKEWREQANDAKFSQGSEAGHSSMMDSVD